MEGSTSTIRANSQTTTALGWRQDNRDMASEIGSADVYHFCVSKKEDKHDIIDK